MHTYKFGGYSKNQSPSEGHRQGISKLLTGSFSEQLQDHLGSRKSSQNSTVYDYTGINDTIIKKKTNKKRRS